MPDNNEILTFKYENEDIDLSRVILDSFFDKVDEVINDFKKIK